MTDNKKNEPIYYTIAKDIRDNLFLGSFSDGIPGEYTLCEKYGVSRITIRHALSLLIKWGIIYSQAGKGYFISDNTSQIYYFKSHDFDMPIEIDYSKLVNFDVICPDIYQVYDFQIHPDSKLLVIKTKLYRAEILVGYEEKYMPYYAGMPILEDDLNVASLEKLVMYRQPDMVINKTMNITACRTKESIASILEIEKDSVISEIRVRITDDGESVCGYSIAYLNSNIFSMTFSTVPVI